MRDLKIFIAVAALLSCNTFQSWAQNPLIIPDTLSGTVFNLNVQSGIRQFIGLNNTPTYGYNGNFLGPTLIMNKGDSVTLNVTNSITQPTTVHWHGFHVSPQNDGGPHQIIAPAGTWNPSFKVRNEAGTFWYHPHGEGKTEIQISKGLAGMIILRDSTEATYTLPRRYGVDDFPLIVQSKAFDILYQIATASHEDSINMVNGTIDPYLEVPAQVVRLRLLNGAADRTYNFGLSDSSYFYQIGSDGGLLSQPHLTNRVRLSTGERAEVLVDFSAYPAGTQLYLKSYASELPRGIIGADSVGTSTIVIMEGYYSNPLNGADFNVLRFDVVPPTPDPVTTIPSSFNPKVPIPEANASMTRSIHFTADTAFSGEQGFVDGPFLMNETPFHMDSINIITWLNTTEIWTLTNSTMVAHPFHIHDIEFFVLDINGVPPPPQYQGLKDVILVQPEDTVRFITKFSTFADPVVPYMFHCHLLHHEDDGMMGTFLVIDSSMIGIEEPRNELQVIAFPNPVSEELNIVCTGIENTDPAFFHICDLLGREIVSGTMRAESVRIPTAGWSAGVYTLGLVKNGKKSYKKIVKAN